MVNNTMHMIRLILAYMVNNTMHMSRIILAYMVNNTMHTIRLILVLKQQEQQRRIEKGNIKETKSTKRK